MAFPQGEPEPDAPGGPGIEPRWTSSAKSGVGTAAPGSQEIEQLRGSAIEFTFYWRDAQRWEGKNFRVQL